jgi:BirA family biotin operon repressor/biotin-[acetyl-CoA-carboxylase] ligase
VFVAKKAEQAPHMTIGCRLLSFSTTTSTNAVAARYASDRANHGLVIIADEQTAGRGQYSRTWSAPPGSSVLMSVLLFPPPALRRAAILTAWAAVSVCETILALADVGAAIKWPNDVLIDDKKVCGILSEGGQQYVIVGIGLNVNQSADDFERLELPAATSLSIAAERLFEVQAVAERLIGDLNSRFQRLTGGDMTGLETDWQNRLGLLGQRVTVETLEGYRLRGRLRRLDFAAVELEKGIGDATTIAPEAIRHITLEAPNH